MDAKLETLTKFTNKSAETVGNVAVLVNFLLLKIPDEDPSVMKGPASCGIGLPSSLAVVSGD